MNEIGIGIGTADGDGDENNGRNAEAEMGRRRGTRVRALGDYIMARRWMSCVLSIQPPAPLFVSRYEETWFDARLGSRSTPSGAYRMAAMRLRWLFSSTSVRPTATAGFRISRGTELRGGRGRVECATAHHPRPGEGGEGGGDAWRVAGDCGCGRMVCHCARLFWLLVSQPVPAPSRTPRTCSRVDVDSR